MTPPCPGPEQILTLLSLSQNLVFFEGLGYSEADQSQALAVCPVYSGG